MVPARGATPSGGSSECFLVHDRGRDEFVPRTERVSLPPGNFAGSAAVTAWLEAWVVPRAELFLPLPASRQHQSHLLTWSAAGGVTLGNNQSRSSHLPSTNLKGQKHLHLRWFDSDSLATHKCGRRPFSGWDVLPEI